MKTLEFFSSSGMIPAMLQGHVRFSDIVIDPHARELRRAGAPVAVERRVLDLLLFLIEHRDRAVSKDELQDAVWAGRIVSETALTRAIMKARRAVGDDSNRQAVIRTVHGHGYRFVADLDAATADSSPDAGKTKKSPLPAVTGPRVFGALVLIALVAVAALLLLREQVTTPTRVAVLPVVDATGDADLSWTRLGLMSYANRMLAEATGSQPLPARRVLDAFDSAATPAELEALRKRLGVTHLIAAELHSGDNELELSYHVAHAGGVTPKDQIVGSEPTTLARRMIRQIVPELPGGGLRREFRTVSEDPFVNEAYARGMSLQLEGEVARARAYFEVAVSQAPELFWPRYELALSLRDLGELDQAQEMLEQLLEHEAAARDSSMMASVGNALSQVYWRRGELDRAIASAETALETARRSNNAQDQLTPLINLGIYTRQMDDPDAARDYLGQALALAQDSGQPVPGAIYQSLGQVEREAGNLSLALDYYQRARDAFRKSGERRFAAAAGSAIARVLHRQGHYAAAEEQLIATVREREALGYVYGIIDGYRDLAHLYRDAENWTLALQSAEAALATAMEADYVPGITSALGDRIHIALLAGDHELAAADLDQWRDDWPSTTDGRRFRLLANWLDLETSGSEQSYRYLTERAQAASGSERLDALTALAWHAGASEAASRYLHEAVAAAEADKRFSRALALRAALARVYLDEGRPDDAREVVEGGLKTSPEWPALGPLLAQLDSID